jgi:hypothetical protein
MTFEEQYADLIAQVPIDKLDLDNQIVAQPELLRRVGDELSQATAQRDDLKRELAELEAAVDADIRETAERTKEKVTEAEIKRMITLNPTVIKMTKVVASATLTVGRLANLRDAYIERGKLFKVLGQLYHDEYWSRDGVGGTGTRNDRDRAEQRQDAIRETIRKKKRA